MGTSSSYGGPGKGGSLLPPWAGEVTGSDPASAPPDGGMPPVASGVASATFPGAKASLTRFGTSGGTPSEAGRRHLRSAISGYVRAQGGARAASGAARAGRHSAQALGAFLWSASTQGPERALASIGLAEHLGSDASTLLGVLVDRLAPTHQGLEDNVARSAMTKTLHTLFEERGVSDGGLAALGAPTADDIPLIVEEYVARYIDERLIQVMGDGLQALSMDEIVLREKEVWDFIRNTVRLDLQGVNVLKLDWSSREAAVLIDRIFTEAHHLLERS